MSLTSNFNCGDIHRKRVCNVIMSNQQSPTPSESWISGVKFHSLDIVPGMRNMSVKKHHRVFIAKLSVFCVHFVYALITYGCLFRFISCIVYLWLMFLPFT